MVCALARRFSLCHGIKVVMCLGRGAVRNGLVKVIGVRDHWTDGDHQDQGQTKGEHQPSTSRKSAARMLAYCLSTRHGCCGRCSGCHDSQDTGVTFDWQALRGWLAWLADHVVLGP